MYDYNTKNKSFLDVHKQLKKLGIQNNSFFLELQNEELQGVDPYDPSLSDDIKRLIIKECCNNIFYFLREVIRLPNMAGNSMPLKLDKGSLAAIYSFNHSPKFLSDEIKTTSDIGNYQSTTNMGIHVRNP